MGLLFLVFDSSGEPAAHPGSSACCAPGGSGTEFEVGRTTSCEEGADATVIAPMGYESSMSKVNFSIRRDLSRSLSLLFPRSTRSLSS